MNKTFENDKLKLFVDPNFYGKEATNEEDVLKLFETANVMNLAGKDCVDLAIKLGYVDIENILEIDGCPHAQVLRI